MDSQEYAVLVFNFKQTSCDGQIDYEAWVRQGFPSGEAVTIMRGGVRRDYYPCGGRFYEVSGNAQLAEMRRRFFEDASAANDMSIVKGRVRYRGELLNYSTHVYGKGAVWGGKDPGRLDELGFPDPHQAFRFGDYLIFLVQARMYFREDPWDLVLYNLKDGTYAVHRTFGSWPIVFLFRSDEGVPDPRMKGEGEDHPK